MIASDDEAREYDARQCFLDWLCITVASSSLCIGLSTISLGALRIGERLWKPVPQLEDNIQAYCYSMLGVLLGMCISIISIMWPVSRMSSLLIPNTSFNQAMSKALFMFVATATWAAGVASAAATQAIADRPLPCNDDQHNDDPCHAVNHLEKIEACKSWSLGIAVVGLGTTTLVLGEHLLRSCYKALAERQHAAQRHNRSSPLLPQPTSAQYQPLTVWGFRIAMSLPPRPPSNFSLLPERTSTQDYPLVVSR